MGGKLAFSLCGTVLPQVGLADFLASGAFDADLQRLRRLLEENPPRPTRTIEVSFPPDTRVSRPAGGFALWLELPRRFDARVLFEEAIAHGLCFAPGDVFSASRRFRNCPRLSAGSTWGDRIDQGRGVGVHPLARSFRPGATGWIALAKHEPAASGLAAARGLTRGVRQRQREHRLCTCSV